VKKSGFQIPWVNPLATAKKGRRGFWTMTTPSRKRKIRKRPQPVLARPIRKGPRGCPNRLFEGGKRAKKKKKKKTKWVLSMQEGVEAGWGGVLGLPGGEGRRVAPPTLSPLPPPERKGGGHGPILSSSIPPAGGGGVF